MTATTRYQTLRRATDLLDFVLGLPLHPLDRPATRQRARIAQPIFIAQPRAMEPSDDLSDSEYLPVTDNEPSNTNEVAQQPARPAERATDGLKQSTLSFGRPSPSEYLAKLNPAQREAVTASAEGGLAIHAGPGSGKTAVLTTRVAYLVQKGGIKPEELV